MTMRQTAIQKLAALVAGARKPCPDYCPHGERCGGFHSALNACLSCPVEHPLCHGTGQVFVLDERARRDCRHYTAQGYFGTICKQVKCPGFEPRFLLEPEPCLHAETEWHPERPNNPGCEDGFWLCLACGASKGKAYRPILEHWEGGSGQVQRVDEGLLRAVLEAAGFRVEYDGFRFRWRVVGMSREEDPLFLEAAAKALGVEGKP